MANTLLWCVVTVGQSGRPDGVHCRSCIGKYKPPVPELTQGAFYGAVDRN